MMKPLPLTGDYLIGPELAALRKLWLRRLRQERWAARIEAGRSLMQDHPSEARHIQPLDKEN